MQPAPDAYRTELAAVLPADLPNRPKVLDCCALHLARMAEINTVMNLTRIVEPREAAVKHVLDSIWPWQRFETAQVLADIGSGAGFPGIPLAAVFPHKRFLLIESTGKKASFIRSVAVELGLKNVEVRGERAEAVLRGTNADVAAARAVGAIEKLLKVLAPALRNVGTLVLYKGPDADEEIAAAGKEAQRLGLAGNVALRYELPDGAGSRTIVEYRRRGSHPRQT